MAVKSQHAGAQIILLNGASSSGKSSIARALQQQLASPYLHLSIDHLRDSGALPLDRFRNNDFNWSDVREKFFEGFERAIAGFAEAGNNLIVEYIIETPEWMRRLETLLAAYPVLFVGVHCSLEELERREVARGDRSIGDARRDFFTVHSHCIYDLEVDSRLPPKGNATHIIAHLQATQT